MRMFIEVHKESEPYTPHLVNINHIVEVIGNTIYTDDILPDAYDYPSVRCCESYEEIKEKIGKATKGAMV